MSAPVNPEMMNIRFAQKQDITQIVKLCALHANFENAIYNPTNKEKYLSKYLFDDSNHLQCLVAENDKEIVGYATFIPQFSTWDANYYLYLDCLFCKEDARGKGFGSLLMNKIKEVAKSKNYESIQWQTPFFNHKAIAFYKKLGVQSKTKERFFWDIKPKIVMNTR